MAKNKNILRTLETDIRRQIKDYLWLKGWLVLYHLQGLGSCPGLPDLQAIKNGQVVFIELKRLGGKQSERQKEFQAKLEAAGGTYILCRTIEDIEHL